MHQLLMRRKEELEAQLTRARGTDFTGARTDVVSIGTIVHATNLDSSGPEIFTVLGAWDFDADKSKAGEEVEAEVDGARHRHRIERIEAFKPAS